VKHFALKALVVAFVLSTCAASVQAQALLRDIGIDSSLRVAYLLGRQVYRYNEARGGGFDRWRMDYGTQLPMLSGMFELSPIRLVSARLAGSISVLEKNTHFNHTMADPAPSVWSVLPGFKHWEAAGLIHLWNGGGYRFSVVGGYRKEYWTFEGTPSADQPANSSSSDRITAEIPFVALQTAMFFPWWKARFEVLGSPFMSKRILTEFRYGTGVTFDYDGRVDHGGLIEVELEGTASITSRIRLGAYARYSFQELYGESTRSTPAGFTRHELFAGENVAVTGLNLTLAF